MSVVFVEVDGKVTSVTMSMQEYVDLKAGSDMNQCLADVGVDNWNGYEEAQTMFREQREDSPEQGDE